MPVTILVLLHGLTIRPALVLAQSGSPASSATPSDTTPDIDDSIVVTINIDMSSVSAPDNALGSFTGSLDWDPDVLAYSSNSGILAGFTGYVNVTQASSGHMVFNGANVTGATGNIVVLTITFDAVGAGTSPLDLEYPAMAAAGTFASLLPILTVNDGEVVVSLMVQYTLTMAASPLGGGTTNPPVGIHDYDEGTVVNATATAAPECAFNHWGGDCAGTGLCQVTMNEDKWVTAHFICAHERAAFLPLVMT